MSSETTIAVVKGQPSYLLRTRSVNLAITRLGAMIGPVDFLRHSPHVVQPYAIAPWALDPPCPQADPFLQALRGDFMCSAFGDNDEPIDGRLLPAHGDTVHASWTPVHQLTTTAGVSLRLGCHLPTQGGRCEVTTVLVENHSLVYQRHDFSGIDGPINPGHHAMLQFPAPAGSGSLSFSPFAFAQTVGETWSEGLTRSSLEGSMVIQDLARASLRNGTEIDLTTYPARPGFEDALILCADPNMPFAWSAATFSAERYVWFALRSPKLLPSTLLWFSNGGRSAPPWNNRHVGVLGIEDIMGFFGSGLARSAAPNELTKRGIATSINLTSDATLRIPYIQGVAPIPSNFDRVASMEAHGERLVIRSVSGERVVVDCHVDFLEHGRIAGLCDD